MKKIIITEAQLHQLKRNIKETVIGGNIIAYHGSDHDFKKFTDEFMGSQEASDQEGPGIYFTTSRNEALHYGKFLYSVILRPNKLLDETSSKNIKPIELKKIIKQLPEWELNAQDWDENPERGLNVAIQSFIQYNDTEKDLFQQVWIDFFRYNPIIFAREMVKLGYDGQIINKENRQHIIVYNPNIIEITNIEIV